MPARNLTWHEESTYGQNQCAIVARPPCASDIPSGSPYTQGAIAAPLCNYINHIRTTAQISVNSSPRVPRSSRKQTQPRATCICHDWPLIVRTCPDMLGFFYTQTPPQKTTTKTRNNKQKTVARRTWRLEARGNPASALNGPHNVQSLIAATESETTMLMVSGPRCNCAQTLAAGPYDFKRCRIGHACA